MTTPGSEPNAELMASVSKQIEWRMSPSVCILYQNIDPKSKLGLSMTKMMMEYEKTCAGAKITLIENLTNLLAKTDNL
jgi:hypothetical protein